MNLLALLFALLGGVGGPFPTRVSPELYENSQFLMLLADTINTRTRNTPTRNTPTRNTPTHNTLRFCTSEDSKTGTRFIVKFDSPPAANERLFLANAGLIVEGYLPHYAYLVSGNSEAVQKLLDAGSISWASVYQPEWKISLLLRSEHHPDTLHLWLFPDADVNKTESYLTEEFDAILHSSHDGINKTMMISVDDDYLLKIATLNVVRWIEPFYAPVFFNDNAQWVLQTWQQNNRSLWERGLDGTGVVACTGDAGLTTSHVMFRDSTIDITVWGDYPSHRKVIAYQPSAPEAVFGDMPSVSYHGTHTAGTVCGEDSYWEENSPYDGMAPGARLYFIDVGSASGIAYPEDYNDMYQLPWEGNTAGRAKLMSNSWGSKGGYRLYDIPCRQTDEFVWNHPDFLILYSAGNSSSAGVSPPSTAKNVVAVGATLNGYSAAVPAGFSSQGPAGDGRIKPALTAPGQTLISADGGTQNGYHGLYGTSMSCPAVAGACALMVQYLRDGWYPSGSPTFFSTDAIEPSAALLKAMLISSTLADFASNPIPDPKVGWGRVCVDSVLYFAGEENRLYIHDDTTGLQTGYESFFNVEVEDKNWPLRVTLVWTDYPAEPAASKKIVNDLDLVAQSPSGKIYRGNVFSDNYSEQNGNADNTNVEECLRIKNPELGTWKIRVIATNVPETPQPYALVITGQIEAGRLQLTGEEVVIDDSANPDPDGALDPGEEVTLYPRLLNIGEITAEDVMMTLSSDSPLLSITSAARAYGTIHPAETSDGEGFHAKLDSSAQKGMDITLQGIVQIAGKTNLDTIIYPIIVGITDIGEKQRTAKPVLVCPSFISAGATILLTLPTANTINLSLYDVTGRIVQRLAADEMLKTGSHTFALQTELSAGVYFMALSAGEHRERLKIIKLKD